MVPSAGRNFIRARSLKNPPVFFCRDTEGLREKNGTTGHRNIVVGIRWDAKKERQPGLAAVADEGRPAVEGRPGGAAAAGRQGRRGAAKDTNE